MTLKLKSTHIMMKIKLIFQSSILILLLGCNKTPIDVTLQEKTTRILEKFEKGFNYQLNEYKKFNVEIFYELTLSKHADNELELQIYLVEYRLNDFINEFKAHSKYNGYDVVIYGDLSPLFYNTINSKKTTFKHKYGSSKNQMYDPPYWNLYFDNNGNLIRTSPKEIYDFLDIPKAK